MIFVLIFLFTAVPVFELMLLFRAGATIGALNTLGVVILTGVVGAALAKSQGLSLLARMREMSARGEVPAEEVIQGFMVLAGGLLLMTPGFVTDALGFAMVMPITRILFAKIIKAYFLRKIQDGSVKFYHAQSTNTWTPPQQPPFQGEIKEAKVTEVRDVTPEERN